MAYSIDELTDKIIENNDLTGHDAPKSRLVRDWVTRVLGHEIGRGNRRPYDDQIYYEVLVLLELKAKTGLPLLDIGVIIRNLSDDVIERLAKGEERLEIPELSDPDTYTKFLQGKIKPELGETVVSYRAGVPESYSEDIPPHLRQDLPDDTKGAAASKSPMVSKSSWLDFKTGQRARLQVKGPISIAKRRQLEKLAELVKVIVESPEGDG